MPPRTNRLKVPPHLQKQPEKTDKELAVRSIVKAVAAGEFDTYLDVLFTAVDDRIREYQQEPGDQLNRTASAPQPSANIPELVFGWEYYLLGEKYSGVVVKYQEDVEPRDGDGGVRKVKVLCTEGNAHVSPGKYYKLPAAALTDVRPDSVAKPEPHQPVYGHSRENCRACGGPVEYSGRGRPPKICVTCR